MLSDSIGTHLVPRDTVNLCHALGHNLKRILVLSRGIALDLSLKINSRDVSQRSSKHSDPGGTRKIFCREPMSRAGVERGIYLLSQEPRSSLGRKKHWRRPFRTDAMTMTW